MKVKEYFGLRDFKGDVGLELEVEAKKALPPAPPGWSIKPEGSLRGNAIEYATSGNVKVATNLSKTVKTLTTALEPCQVLEDSNRTSYHVHVNVLDYDVTNIYTVAVIYWLLENLLMKFCGEEREGNHFCLRLKDSEYLLQTLCHDAVKGRDLYNVMNGREMRYTALNLCSLERFGSVEFRAMRGTIDPKVMITWAEELYNMCIRAKKITPSEAMDLYFIQPNKESFLRLFFAPAFIKELKSYKNWEDLIQENEAVVCELAYIRDWKKSVELAARKPKKKAPIPRFVIRQDDPLRAGGDLQPVAIDFDELAPPDFEPFLVQQAAVPGGGGRVAFRWADGMEDVLMLEEARVREAAGQGRII